MCFRCSGDNSGVIPRGSGGGSSSCTEQNVSSKGNSWRGNEGSPFCNREPSPSPPQEYSAARGAADSTSRASSALVIAEGFGFQGCDMDAGLKGTAASPSAPLVACHRGAGTPLLQTGPQRMRKSCVPPSRLLLMGIKLVGRRF